MAIHPTAIIERGAQVPDSVEIGPYAYIGPHVTLGEKTVVDHHASVEGVTFLGEGNRIFPYACIGGLTQDLKYKGNSVGLKIGNRNIFREYVTVHSSTDSGKFTEIGDDNAFLAYSHIAHDCNVGNHVIMSSLAALGGYVTVGNYVNIGWNAGIHQFCRVGDYAMLAASSKTVMDVLPFMIVDGSPSRTRAFNKVNLERQGFEKAEIEAAKNVFRLLFFSKTPRKDAVEYICSIEHTCSKIYSVVLKAVEASVRGFC